MARAAPTRPPRTPHTKTCEATVAKPSSRRSCCGDALTEAAITCWADKGYQGATGTVRLPDRGLRDSLSTGQNRPTTVPPKDPHTGRTSHCHLKSWRLLRKLRCSTTRITSLVQAVRVRRLAATGGDQPAVFTRSVNAASVVPARRQTSKV